MTSEVEHELGLLLSLQVAVLKTRTVRELSAHELEVFWERDRQIQHLLEHLAVRSSIH